MTIGNYFAYVFLGLGGIMILYCVFISYKWMRSGSIVGTLQGNATKQDIIDLKDGIAKAVEEGVKQGIIEGIKEVEKLRIKQTQEDNDAKS